MREKSNHMQEKMAQKKKKAAESPKGRNKQGKGGSEVKAKGKTKNVSCD